MRHKKELKKLNRPRAQRKALKKQLASDLIMKEKISTTVTKAKFIKPYIDKIITISQKKTVNAKHQLSVLLNKQASKKLRKELAGKFNKKGGFTKIVKLGCRKGDNAPLARVEILYNQLPVKKIKN